MAPVWLVVTAPFPVTVVAVMLVGFAVVSPLGVAPAWVAAAAAAVLAAHPLARRRLGVRRVVHATHLSFEVFVLGLGVVVTALAAGDAAAGPARRAARRRRDGAVGLDRPARLTGPRLRSNRDTATADAAD